MTKARVLLVADAPEVASHLNTLLAGQQYEVVVAEGFAAPPPCDVALVDVSRTMGSPLAGLQAQRRMGFTAPAILFSTRLTDQMAMELFPLGIRQFVLKPVDEGMTLSRVEAFIAQIRHEKDQLESGQRLEQTEAALARRLEEMTILSRIGRAIASLSDLDTMLSHIVDAAVYLAHSDEGAIYLVSPTGALLLRAEKGLGAQQAEAIQRPSNDSDAMETLRTGQPVRKDGAEEHKVKTGYLVRALVNVPIVIAGQAVGVLAAYNHSTRAFSETDQAILGSLGDYAAIALDKVGSLQKLETRIEAAFAASREVALHAETLLMPVEGIESLADTLLSGGFDPLTEKQQGAVTRIQQASSRLSEIVGFINQTIARFRSDETVR